ncbi:hypothetical protein F5Y17DRAFT_332015 [Xylariaceae sp. FL0594]|nr:hypothetical protein F5Y17DRAFT_332015 [Xylariaceae sp. FL0594]
MKVRLVNIPHSEVEADAEAHLTRADSDNTTNRRFNTSFHTALDAPDLPARPPEAPYSFKRWLPLILCSRGLPPSSAQVVSLTLSQARLLLRVSEASILIRRLNRIYLEELEEYIVPAFASLTFPPEGLFMRLDACSAKDGQQKIPGSRALRSVDQILLLLLTSQRARNALAHALDDVKEGRGGDKAFELFFTPFSPRMQSDREYRVFCPPFHPAESLRVTAISQYRWHKPWLFASSSEEERQRAVERIVRGVETIARQIAKDVVAGDEIDELLMRQGLSFDVSFDEEQDRVELIELNVFGASSACGSCLFHWIRDRETLESRGGSEELEFRVTYHEPAQGLEAVRDAEET